MYKKLYVGLCVFIAVVLATQPIVYAELKEDFVKNEIIFYTDSETSCTPSGANISGENNKEKIWNYLRGSGLSEEQTAGVMGNMQAESGFSPTRHEDSQGWSGGGWGLVQWTGGRRKAVVNALPENLKKYHSEEYGGATTDGRVESIPMEDNDALLAAELDFMIEESSNRPITEKRYGTAASEWELLKTLSSIEDAAVFWHNNFEVSSDSPSKVIKSRGGFAQKIYDEYKGSGGGGGGDNCEAETGDLSEYVLKYAWPEYSKPNTNKKPEYVDAIIAAKNAGRYVGDSCYGGGVDCGGFVTTLMYDSGFDKGYNYGSVIKDGAGPTGQQEKWLKENWESLGSGSSIDAAELKPGDVAMSPGHTFVYVGEISGFNSKIASASQCERAPMAGKEEVTSGKVTWYRKKSTGSEDKS